MNCGPFWVIVFFVLINNGCSLLGFGEGSVGGVARSIESRTEITIATTLQRAQKTNAGGLPPDGGQLLPAIFLLVRA
ncbi:MULTISPECIES: hypothetical protein [Pseudomonas]|uniref:hypothetical protein n=1 Tax=Pseudomonas TaxID=286 RepID=UPI000A1EC989|nr:MULTISPECIES: hypothetical protein [Pseudomonas]WJD68204.1 hypothetical protein QQ994_16355 [Pseudomonas asiatica]WJN49616.1 hypothetical protein QUR91_23720 [Pseudomonas asiatica]